MKDLNILMEMINDPAALIIMVFISFVILLMISILSWVFLQERTLEIQTKIREGNYKNKIPFLYSRIVHINQKRDKKYFNMFIKEVAAREAIYPPKDN